ncbi:hypothetical protein [Gracilimonas sediminicola]|uniref:hypothetical protein n=1 Tax=Gracilimonas sediminicola TaxID=2952158 RepID=UPI0038D4AD28
MHKHRIILKNFNLENGKISFSKLAELQDRLTALAEGAVLNLIEGRSKPGRGQKPKWLKEVIDFQITGLNPGSTILEIEAPEISQVYQGKQFGIFDEVDAEKLLNESAFGLSSYVYDKAISQPESSGMLDKYLLQKVTDFNKILDNDNSEINLISNGKSKVKSVSIKKKTLEKVSITEQKTRESVKTPIIGTLDVMRHKKEQMEIVTTKDQRIRAFPGNNLNIKNLKKFFGEKVKITGLAHFKTDGNLKYIEILDIQTARGDAESIEELTLPIFEEIDLKRLAKEQEWQGFNEGKFKQSIKDMKVEESPEELLELLKE